MSFIQAFLESGRSKGEYLEHLEGVQTVALETFAIDANEIVEIFNRILSDDVGFSLSVQAVENFKTGLILSIPHVQGDIKSIYIDIGYVPQSQDYTVNERGSDQVSKCQEFDMQLAVAEIIFKNLPDEQYIKFYRGLQNAAPAPQAQQVSVQSAEVVSFAPVEMVPVHQQTNARFDEGQFVSIESLTETTDSVQAPEQNATIMPFPNSGAHHQYQDVTADTPDEDEDDIWGDDDDEGSHDSVSKHLSTDVNMR